MIDHGKGGIVEEGQLPAKAFEKPWGNNLQYKKQTKLYIFMKVSHHILVGDCHQVEVPMPENDYIL